LIALTPEDAVVKRGIDLRLLHEVIRINRERKTVTVKDIAIGTIFDQAYEKLIIATGARPVSPDVPGSSLSGIFHMKAYHDGLDIKDFLEKVKPGKVAVIGGGYIGVEACEAFRELGLEVTLVEAGPRVMASMDGDMGELVLEELRKRSVEVILNRKMIGLTGSDRVKGMILDNGSLLEADCVLMAIGVEPNSALAEDAGLELGENNAIRVDRYLKTNDPDIFAAGDCSTVYHRTLDRDVYIPLALGSNRQGRMCGENIAAELTRSPLRQFPGISGTAVTKFFDCEMARTGIGQMEIQRYDLAGKSSVKVRSENLPRYYPGASDLWVKLYFEDDSKIVVGGQIIGRSGAALRINIIASAVAARMTLEELHNLDTAYAPPFSPVWDPITIAARVGLKE
jgi:NADPH-dependent 2,4-dienoyl-CoA reductase/sulfur reductase-like enzyme